MSVIDLKNLKKECIKLLKKLISTPSLSKEEHKTAEIIESFLRKKKLNTKRKDNNIWIENNNYDNDHYTILLNSHHDTIKPSNGWETDPFIAKEYGNKIIGLGSNDAGGSVVSLIATFLYINSLPKSKYKLILIISAEEEIRATRGVESILCYLGQINLGIIGEPTNMHMAIAEKGLIVLDCLSIGTTGHAARFEGINALYLAIDDIFWLKNYVFKNKSYLLGNIKLTVTKIQCGIQRNVIPDTCYFTVDIRTNEIYSHEYIINKIKKNLKSKIISSSYRLKSSYIDPNHNIVKTAKNINIKIFGSPTLSDQSVMNFPTVKLGVGDSSRSHTPNEYILISEIEFGIDLYINLLLNFSF
ncbi:M20 family metallo-hydrolase [Candidatus Karelsulcia muelleri]|uniref:M20/M25/M40 family metallo-hydrolase n=1 Tax=Candidatus Karelsulcia muelleri TaxID=336810 RepID=A0A3A1MMH1_9FLAO|nr:M20 family metallo-hydrolase [Candidatus Karelsulcia muelleri]RIU86153.1 M20/M25/M40 family metallo-hydrolase [Candidatus Karelsulcia muelleri]